MEDKRKFEEIWNKSEKGDKHEEELESEVDKAERET